MSAMAFLRMAARSAGSPGVAPNGRLALRSPEKATHASRSLGSAMPSTNFGSAATSALRGSGGGAPPMDNTSLMVPSLCISRVAVLTMTAEPAVDTASTSSCFMASAMGL